MFKAFHSGAGNLILLALTYFLYFGNLGVLVPFLGVFLDGRGLNSAEIGELTALITLTRLAGPNLWAFLADKSGRGLSILQLGAFLTVATFSLIFFVNGFWGLTLSFAMMMMFWTAILPQMEVISMRAVNSQANRYSRLRLWGSVGYIVLTVVGGKFIDLYSSEATIYLCFGVLLMLFFISMLLNSNASSKAQNNGEGQRPQLFTRTFICFMLATILLQVSFGPFYGFFSLYMRDLGYSGQHTGLLIALGVLAEIAIFLVAGKLIGRIGVKAVLVVSMLLTALRWWLLAEFAQAILWLIISQLLHAFSFGLCHAASIYFIHRYFSHGWQSRGQALYSSIGFGIGGVAGGYLAGRLWHQGQGATVTLLAAAITALLAACVIQLADKTSMDNFDKGPV